LACRFLGVPRLEHFKKVPVEDVPAAGSDIVRVKGSSDLL
jgi:hypothetical protein